MKKQEKEFTAIKINANIKGLNVSGNTLHGEGSILDLKGNIEDAKISENVQIKPNTKNKHNWHTNPFLIAILLVIATVISAGIIFYLGLHKQ